MDRMECFQWTSVLEFLCAMALAKTLSSATAMPIVPCPSRIVLETPCWRIELFCSGYFGQSICNNNTYTLINAEVVFFIFEEGSFQIVEGAVVYSRQLDNYTICSRVSNWFSKTIIRFKRATYILGFRYARDANLRYDITTSAFYSRELHSIHGLCCTHLRQCTFRTKHRQMWVC